VQDELETWTRFMSAALTAAPHAPVDVLAARADEALAEYRQRLEPGASGGNGDPGGHHADATQTPFVAIVEEDSVRYEPTSTAPDEDEIDSPFRPGQ
jgi:hypothetical protein